MKPTGILLIGLLLSSSPSGADIILLKNGKTLEGKLQDLGNGKVRIHLDVGSLKLSSEQIESVEEAATLGDVVVRSLEDLPADDAEGRFQLARLAADEQSLTLSRRLLEEVIAIDPHHSGARRALGYIPHGDSWVTEEQLHLLQGEISFRGEWMARKTRDQILLQEATLRAQEKNAQIARAEARQEARAQRLEERQAEEDRQASYRQPSALPSTWSSPFYFGSNSYGASHFGAPHGAGVYSYGGYSPYNGYGALAYQPLRPFQLGLIQVPNQHHYRTNVNRSRGHRHGSRHVRPQHFGSRKNPASRNRRH